jgi:hypothetical protein
MKNHVKKICLMRKALRKHLAIDQVKRIRTLIDAALAIDRINCKFSRKELIALLKTI